ncbi:MAG: hypothetical protein ACKUBY_04185 [Candidatus Moraniibacteriota bacterium]|jgi:hypothetical protein
MKKTIMLILVMVGVGAVVGNANSTDVEDSMKSGVGRVHNAALDSVKANWGKCQIKLPGNSSVTIKKVGSTVLIGQEALICTSDGWVNIRYLGKP